MHSTLTIKQRNEQAAFLNFVRRMGTDAAWLNVYSQPEPQPDLLCSHASDGLVAFELVSITDPTIAKVQAAGLNAWEGAFFTADSTEKIVRKKLSRRYTTSANHIELLVYTDGQTITPDDAIIPTILPLLEAVVHPFQRVWFMGEFATCCLWRSS